MKAFAMLREAFRSDGWSTAALVAILLCGFLSLVSAEWDSAVLFFSVLAVLLGASSRVERRSQAGDLPRWARGMLLAGGIGLLGLACAHVIGGDVRLAVFSGLAGAAALAAAGMEWRRTSAGRLGRGRH